VKKSILAYCLTALCIHVAAQSSQSIRKVVRLDTESVSLNGGIRSDFGGKSRVLIPIDLPPNTVEWYYTFSTTPINSPALALSLVSQLTKLLDPTGELSIVLSAIFTPTGTHVCDIYLMNEPNANAFLAKMDQKGRPVTCIESAKRENIRNGVVQIKDTKTGRWFLGFATPAQPKALLST
jgi:hypothetical protein